MLEQLLGPEGRQRLALRDKPNEELFRLYDDELVLHLNNPKNIKTTRKLLDDFRQYLGEARPSPEGAKGFLKRFIHLSTGTRAWYTLAIKGFMKWCGLPLEDVHVKVGREIPTYVETDDVLKLLEAAGDKRSHKDIVERDKLLIETLWRTGLRRAEAARLCPRDIAAAKIFVRKGKGEKDRVVPLLPSLEQKLAEFSRGMPPDKPIFGLTEGTISNKIRDIARRAGLTGMHTHALRHKFATDLLEKNVNIRIVQALLGHENLNTTQVYLSFTDEQLVEAIRSLDTPDIEIDGPLRSGKTIEISQDIMFTPPRFNVNAALGGVIGWESYSFDLNVSSIAVESLSLEISDTLVPFLPVALSSKIHPDDETDWAEENLIPDAAMVYKRMYTWQPMPPLRYLSDESKPRFIGAVLFGQRNLRFDKGLEDNEVTRDYYETPVDIKITLRYTVS